MTSLFQASREKAEQASLAQSFGPTIAGKLSTVAPATTTMAFYKYFKTSGTRIKTFFTHDIPSIFQKPRTPMKMIILSILFIGTILLSVWIYNSVNSYEGFTVNTSMRSNDIENIVNQLIAGPRKPVDTKVNSLFNIQPMTYKQAAFLGPTQNGYFDSKNGILNQLKTGARSFFLQIDYIESANMNPDNFTPKYEPCLLYKNSSGTLTSLNSANLSEVCKSLREYALSDVIAYSTDPILLLLHFVRIPYAPTDSDNYIKYLSKVSLALEEIKPMLINGGYYRAAKETNLFKTDYTSFNKSIIIGTNIDTSVFTKVTVDTQKDLDYKINFRYYQVSTENVDATLVAPINMNVNALIFNASTILKMSPQQWAIYKNYFIIVKTSNDMNLSLEDMNKLLTVYGVNVVTYDYFADNVSASKSVKQLYGSSFTTKPLLLQI